MEASRRVLFRSRDCIAYGPVLVDPLVVVRTIDQRRPSDGHRACDGEEQFKNYCHSQELTN